jgi:zinc protease
MTGRIAATAALLATTCLGAAAALDPTHRSVLPNGLRFVAKPVASTEVVAIELLLDVSAADEPVGKNGIRYLAQRLLLRGSKGESGAAMGWRLAAVGGVADTSVGLDYVEMYALVPAEGLEVALELLAEAVVAPAFDDAEVHRQKAEAADAARRARNDPFQATYLALRERLYSGHAYGTSTLGTPESLACISRDDIVGFHREHYVPNRAVLAICGGVGRARALRTARQAFARWDRGVPARRMQTAMDLLESSDLAVRERPLRRAHLILGFSAPAVGESNYYALQVIDSLLSGGSRARLPLKLREEQALIYHVSSFYPTLASSSHFGIYAIAETEQLRAVKAAIVDVLEDLCERPPSDSEVARAKAYLLGSYALSHQRMKEQAYALAWYELLGLPPGFEEHYIDKVKAVGPEDVQEAARSVLRRFILAVTVPTD